MNAPDFSITMISPKEMATILPIFSTINPSLSESTLTETIDEMTSQGYQCAVARHNGLCIGIIGFWIQTKFYVGRHIEYDNFFVRPNYRGMGAGRRLLEFVNEYAKKQGCIAAELTCDINAHNTKRFWEDQGFLKLGTRFQQRFD